MALRPKSKALVLRPPQRKVAQQRAQIHYCQGHRFIRTPHGWRCDKCQSLHYQGISLCSGKSN